MKKKAVVGVGAFLVLCFFVTLFVHIRRRLYLKDTYADYI